MGAKPSSAVQQSAYLEALDDYIDYYEDGTLRKCLLDGHGQRLRDAEGNLKTLRHKFAVYCDDICAGADTIDELLSGKVFVAPESTVLMYSYQPW